MYTPDLAALCEHLRGHDVAVPAVGHPEYMRSGEIRLSDPDGYTVFVGHWGAAEQEEWMQRIAEAPESARESKPPTA